MTFPLPPDEEARMQALRDLQILDTPPEQTYHDLTLLASHICGAPIALISLVDANRLWFKAKIGLDFSASPRDSAFCARAILTPEVFEVQDAREDSRFAANPLVTGDSRVRFYAGAPLMTQNGHALGALCVMDPVPRELSQAQKNALQALSRQIVAQFELRQKLAQTKLAAKELRWKTAFLEAQVHSTINGLLVVDAEGRKILQNQRAIDLLKIPPHIAEAEDDTSLVQWVAATMPAPAALAERRDYLKDATAIHSHDEIQLQDGTYLDRNTAPVTSKEGEHFGRMWLFRDISQRKRAEAQVGQINEQLMKVSRQAGMAEVATNVLHNVGNVLNSVNVSCCVIREGLRKLRHASVVRTAELLTKHADDLPGFFATDHGAGKLPIFLTNLGQNLVQEQTYLIGEVQSLSNHVEHIKEIVGMQQALARVGAVHEALDIKELLEDALNICSAALEDHRVEIVRDYSEVPPVLAEKHQVLQILINLVGNAKHALVESTRADKRLTVRTANENGSVTVTVSDNGVGIAPEFIDRIFAQGFTTKSDGLGLGLHSSGNMAREMGGSLTAQSGGYGTGATFTLELPLRK